eukprot:1723891-Alexandrium_andersonii.AAC.1
MALRTASFPASGAWTAAGNSAGLACTGAVCAMGGTVCWTGACTSAERRASAAACCWSPPAPP